MSIADPAIAAGLRLHGVNVTSTAEAGLLHARDEEHLAYGGRRAGSSSRKTRIS